VRSVQSKLLNSLRAPQRPLLDLGVGFAYELDTADASMLVRAMSCATSAPPAELHACNTAFWQALVLPAGRLRACHGVTALQSAVYCTPSS
jgi:hypothetical protein